MSSAEDHYRQLRRDLVADLYDALLQQGVVAGACLDCVTMAHRALQLGDVPDWQIAYLLGCARADLRDGGIAPSDWADVTEHLDIARALFDDYRAATAPELV